MNKHIIGPENITFWFLYIDQNLNREFQYGRRVNFLLQKMTDLIGKIDQQDDRFLVSIY